MRVTLAGAELAGLAAPAPGASLRLLLPRPGEEDVAVPVWTGNEFLDADGRRPILRTLTPLAADEARAGAGPGAGDPVVAVEVVLHGEGPLSSWAASVQPGARLAVSGPGRGYEVDASAPSFLVAGDESALPAIGTVLTAVPPTAEVQVIVEIGHADARVDLPPHPRATVDWRAAVAGEAPGTALVAGVIAASIPPDGRVWVAGEAAAVQRIRRHLFEERGFSRRQAVVRGYWKAGRAGDDDPADS